MLQLVVGVIVTFLPLKWGAIVEIVLVAACLLCGGGTVLGGRMIAEREREIRARRAVRNEEEEA